MTYHVKQKMPVASPDAATRIGKLRLDLGKTQEEFAAQLGVSRIAVMNWEKGRPEPAAQNYIQLAKLAKGFPASAMWFWERAGVDQAAVRDLLPEFQRAFKRSEQHLERMVTKSPENVISLPLLKTTAYLHAPATAPDEEIGGWFPVPADFVVRPDRTSLIRPRDGQFPGGREELWMLDSSETRTDKLSGKLVLAAYSVTQPSTLSFGENAYHVDPPGRIYSGFLRPFQMGNGESIPTLTSLRDLGALQEGLVGETYSAMEVGLIMTELREHLLPVLPPWRILGAFVGYLGSTRLPAGEPLRLATHSTTREPKGQRRSRS